MCVYGGSRWGKGGGQTHLNCYACPLGLLTVNGRLQSVINLIYSPRYKKNPRCNYILTKVIAAMRRKMIRLIVLIDAAAGD